MHRHPAENWCKHLIVFSGLPDAEILRLSEMSGMRPFDMEYLNYVIGELKVLPAVRSITDRTTRKWAQDRRIQSLAAKDIDACTARSYIANAPLRRTLEALLLSSGDTQEIVDALRDKFGHAIAPRVLEFYRHYFWDVGNMSYARLTEYLYDHEDRALYLSCLGRDIRYVLWKLGAVGKIPRDDALQTIANTSMMRFMETVTDANTEATAKKSKQYADTAISAYRELSGDNDGVHKTIEHLRRIGLKYAPPQLATLAEIEAAEESK